MSVGSHKDAFKAHQLVKKLVKSEPNPVLARLAADILLDFVKNHRQVNLNFMLDILPEDPTMYDNPKLDSALEAVGALCEKCAENHVNSCFVNQARRILIAAKTRVDLGSDFDGSKTLSQLLEDAMKRAECPKLSDQERPDFHNQNTFHGDIPESYEELRRKYEELREKNVFQATLIEEIVNTIRSVSEGNFEAEMPVHDDVQLGQLATAFNLMLRTINKTMNRLDGLVAERTSELNRSNEALHKSLGQLNEINVRLNRTLEDAERANRHITESIQYAKMIQSSLLPNPENIRTFLPDSFYIWMPRDIVGGDFIFTDYVGDGFVIAVIDCTGHGVPGAFMTMIATLGLKKIIRDEGWRDPAQILRRLSFLVKTTLQQDTDYALSDDGLDAAICFVSGLSSVATDNGQQITHKRQLTFAGAKLPLFYIHNGEINVIKGDRKSLGYKKSDLRFNFTNHTFDIRKGMSFYMFTDGFADQLGGKRNRRLGTGKFKELLKKNAHLPFKKQREILLQSFEEYRGENERQDDVTLLGFGFMGDQESTRQ